MGHGQTGGHGKPTPVPAANIAYDVASAARR